MPLPLLLLGLLVYLASRTSKKDVIGIEANVRKYAPLTEGQFADLLDDLRGKGWVCAFIGSPNVATASKGETLYKFVDDFEMFRAQCLSGACDWSTIDAAIAAFR